MLANPGAWTAAPLGGYQQVQRQALGLPQGHTGQVFAVQLQPSMAGQQARQQDNLDAARAGAAAPAARVGGGSPDAKEEEAQQPALNPATYREMDRLSSGSKRPRATPGEPKKTIGVTYNRSNGW